MRRNELRKQIASTRAEVSRLRRSLPHDEAEQAPVDANAAWHLERAIMALQMAEDAYIPRSPTGPRRDA